MQLYFLLTSPSFVFANAYKTKIQKLMHLCDSSMMTLAVKCSNVNDNLTSHELEHVVTRITELQDISHPSPHLKKQQTKHQLLAFKNFQIKFYRNELTVIRYSTQLGHQYNFLFSIRAWHYVIKLRKCNKYRFGQHRFWPQKSIINRIIIKSYQGCKGL